MPDEKKPPQRTSSGNHEAVKSFRAKMESISDGETAKGIANLDAALDAYLDETREPHKVQTPCEVQGSTLDCVCSRGTKGCNVAHEMEEQKVTSRIKPVSRCPHGDTRERCPICSAP